MIFSKRTVGIYLSYLLIISLYLNTQLYFISNQLFAFRIILPICILYLFFNRYKIQKSFQVYLYILFCYFSYTLLLTFVFPSYANISDIINWIILFLYLLTLMLLFSNFPSEFKKAIGQISLIGIILYVSFAIFEIFTGYHLSASVLNEYDDIRTFVPSVVYVNPNDFCAILTMMLCYCFSYFNSKKTRTLLYLLLIPSLIIIYIAGARLNILLLVFFLFSITLKSTKSFLILIACLIIGFTVLVQYIDLRDLFLDYDFSDDSTSIRKSLYENAINSISHSFGLGFGVNTSAEFYQSIEDPALEQIVDPHSYAFEILINSGVLFFLIYILGSLKIVFNFLKNKKTILISAYIVYFFTLFASSSNIFLMGHYLFFSFFVYEAFSINQINIKCTY